MEIVINRGDGMLWLSVDLIKDYYSEYKAIYVRGYEAIRLININNLKKYELDEDGEEETYFIFYLSNKEPVKYIYNKDSDDYYKEFITIDFSNKTLKEVTDPRFIELVKNHKNTNPNLAVIEIPDDVDYVICSDDYQQWIEERTRKWY